MLKKLKKSNGGFTIIEVMIVLAIAGLILLIVFLAIPALQRNSRNTQRKADASRLSSIISEWQSNNNGKIPAAFGTGTANVDLSGENWSIINPPSGSIAAYTTAATAPAADGTSTFKNATCSGTSPTVATSARSAVVWYGLEGSTKTNCIDIGS